MDAWTLIEKLQVPGLILAAIVILLGYKLFIRVATEMHDQTVLMSKMTALMEIVVSTRIGDARNRDAGGQ